MRSVQSTLFALLAASGAAYANTAFNLTQGVSPISRDVYELHMTIFWICVAIGVVVFSAMFYAIIFHRKSRGAKPADFHSHTWLEIGWTLVPVIILVLMAVPATKVLLNMNNYDKEALTIKITGYQWKWHYEYLEDGVRFFSNLSTPIDQLRNEAPKGENYLREVDNPMVVPIHKKIRLLITSNDVNHAWWVPDLAVKRDGIAGFINEAWTIINKPGTYRGQCAELCGINHAFMPIVVVATTEEGYKAWVAKQKGLGTEESVDVNKTWALKELMDKGQETYLRVCAACHQPNGIGAPPTFPALKGSKIATGPLGDHVNIVFNGKSGTAMQAFKSQLNDTELAAVITYERNAFGNETHSLVQPVQIKALREGKPMAEALLTKPSGKTTTSAPSQSIKRETEAVRNTSPVPVAVATVPSSAPVVSPATESNGPSSNETSPEAQLRMAMQRGENIYLRTCAVCHQPTGVGMPPIFPALKGSTIAKGPVAAHIDRVMNGKPGTTMQAFKDQLNDQDIADVITYERNAWGNQTGTLVKPDHIKAARQAPQPNNPKGGKP